VRLLPPGAFAADVRCSYALGIQAPGRNKVAMGVLSSGRDPLDDEMLYVCALAGVLEGHCADMPTRADSGS
jgi:hypothetical protein